MSYKVTQADDHWVVECPPKTANLFGQKNAVVTYKLFDKGQLDRFLSGAWPLQEKV